MFCTNCGTKINDGDSFCTNCGTKVITIIEKERTFDFSNEDLYDISKKIKGLKCVTDYDDNTTIDKIDSIDIGSYPHSNDIYGDIEWIVLEKDEKNNKALLLSKYILYSESYNDIEDKTSWEKCSLRKWLNNYFFDTIFADDEKEKIVKTIIKTEPNENYQTSGGNDTEDKIFILSKEECIKYFNISDDGSKKLATLSHGKHIENIKNEITIDDF